MKQMYAGEGMLNSTSETFSGKNARQYNSGSGTLTSTGDTFSAHAVQENIGTGKLHAKDDIFRGHSQQNLSATSDSNASHFHDNAIQMMEGTSTGDTFDGEAIQFVEKGSKISGDQFGGSAHQKVNTGATSTDSHFTGAARQLIANDGISLNAIFDGNSGFDETGVTTPAPNAPAQASPQPTLQHVTMKGASVGTRRQNIRATDLTLSDTATLHMEASNASAGGKGADADLVALNSPGSKLVIDDVSSAQQDTAHVGTLAMTGGSLQFTPVPAGKNTPYSALNVDNLSGRGTLSLNIDNVQGKTLNNQVHATSASGQYGILLNTHTSGKELLKGSAPDLVDIDKASHASFDLRDVKGEHIDSVDAGAYLASLKTVTGADGKTHITLNQNTQQTTHSTDAVLGLMSSSQYIFDNELQGLRARRGDIQQNAQGEGGVWGRYINSDMHVNAAGTAAYRKAFALKNGMSLNPYVTVGAEHEFIKSNSVRINDAHSFDNDASSTTGKYGAGLSAQLSKNAAVYAKADYRNGSHVESPVMANVGFRINF